MNQSLQPALDAVMPAVRATGLLSSLGTFQAPSGTLTANGFPDGTYVDVAGLVGLACQVASSRFVKVQGETVKTKDYQQAIDSSYVMFGDFYPDAETCWRNGGRLVIDGQVYPNEDVLLVGADSQSRHTSALIRVVTE